MKVYGVGSGAAMAGIGFAVGACVMHVTAVDATPAPPPPPRPVAPPAQLASPAPPPLAPGPGAPPPPAPRSHPLLAGLSHFSGRTLHPPPLASTGGAQVNITALKLHIQPNRRCGPHEIAPGHWIHIDCTAYTAVKQAKPFTARKVRLMLAGRLRLDSPVSQALPDSVDHRNDGTEGPVKDQGQVGACTSFALSSAMENAIRRQNAPETISPLHIWSHYGFPDMQTAGDSNINRAIAAWETWPYDPRVACELDRSGDGDCGPFQPPVVQGSWAADPSVQVTMRDADKKGRFRVTEFDQVPADPDAMAAILASGADIWISLNIGSTWMKPVGDTIADWSNDQIEGGHVVVLAGYRPGAGQRQFLVHNSWGPAWGDGGYAWISAQAIRQYTKHAYKVVVAAPGPAPSSASDPNALTDDDCGEASLVDAVTGQCAAMCPDDSRPSNGQCAQRP